MTIRKVLLITFHFPPSAASGAFRLLGFARHLRPAGWQPLVIAPPRTPWEPSDPALAAQVPPDVVVRAVPYPFGAPKALRWLLPNAVWLPRAWAACKGVMAEHRPEAVLTSGPPHSIHLLGLWLKRRYGVSWLADFRDPWITAHHVQAGGLASWAPRYYEKKVFDGADALIANAPNAAHLLREALPQHAAKVFSLTNGFDPEEFPVGQVSSEGPIRLVHTGELYLRRDPVPLLDALAAWNREAGRRKARLDVIGRSDLPIDLAEEIRRRGLENDVVMTGQLPYREALQAMAQAGILVLFDTPGRKIGVPAKLYEYFGARRPILALAEEGGDTALVLRDSGVVHRLASPKDAGQIQQALAELAPHAAAAMPPLGERLQRYTRAQLGREMASILDRLVGGRAAAARAPALP